MSKCTKCGNPLPEQIKFCPNCGSPVPDQSENAGLQPEMPAMGRPEAAPMPEPAPQPGPVPQPSPAPQPEPAPQPGSASQPGPASQPWSTPQPTPGSYYQTPPNYGCQDPGGTTRLCGVNMTETQLMVWSIIDLACCCIPLGVVGLVFSLTAKNEPSPEERNRKLRQAAILNIVGTAAGVLISLFFLVFAMMI